MSPPPPRKRPLWLRAVRLLGFVSGLYLVVVVVFKCFETTLVHFPVSGPDDWTPPPAGTEELTLSAADGNTIHAWWLPPPEGAPRQAVLYAHGKGGNLSHRGAAAAEMRTQLGCGVFLFDYPSYGKSTGWPTEAACYAVGEAALGWLKEKGIPADEVVLFGESLGGGVAAELAVWHPPRALVLCSTYTSLPDAATHRYPWLPCHLLMSNRFDTAGKLPRLTCPVVVTHGTADGTIPYRQGERLYAAANEPKEFVSLTGGGHGDWSRAETWAAVRKAMR